MQLTGMEQNDEDAERFIHDYFEKLYFHTHIAPKIEAWCGTSINHLNSKTMQTMPVNHVVFEYIQSMRGKDTETLSRLLDRQAEVEFPFAPSGLPKKIKGSKQICDYVENLPYHMDLPSTESMNV